MAAYAASLQHVFLFAVPVGDGFAVPEGSDNEHQLANVVGQILRRDNRSSLAGILADAGTTLDLATVWGLVGVFVREQAFGRPTREVEEALGRITLRLVREADAEAGRTGVPSGRRAVQAGGGTT